MRKKAKLCLLILLLCLASAACGAAGSMLWMQSRAVDVPQIEQGQPAETEGPYEDIMLKDFPQEEAVSDNGTTTGTLYVSDARKGYVSGSMRLVIPKLDLDEPLLDDVTPEKLAQGNGLYPYAQLPSEENGNVSIAGHRNGTRNGIPVPSRKFYYLNTLTEGDYLYLVYEGMIYQYLWECTEVITPDNWDPIRNRGYGCITLTTCTPIGVADHRLVVRGALVSAYPENANASMPSNR